MYCFGICNSAPEKVLDLLVGKIIKSPSEVSVIPYGTTFSESRRVPKRKVVFVLGISDFLRNLPVLNSEPYDSTIVILFASPLRLNELAGVTLLDSAVLASSKGIGFSMLSQPSISKIPSVCRAGPLVVSRLTKQYLVTLTDTVKQGSLLTPLMTFIYTLSKSSQQTPVKEAVATYFIKNLPITKLDQLIGSTLTEKSWFKLQDLLESESALPYRLAFQELKERGQKALKSICAAHKVAEYEVRYLQSVLTSKEDRGHMAKNTMSVIDRKNLRNKSSRVKPASAGA